MGLHKLTAGDGYSYLTRQVAAHDSTEKGHTGLGDYYSQKGESPGRWLGSGLTGLDGVQPGDDVSPEQMKALFGEGRHPNAEAIEHAAIATRGGAREALRASKLGRAFPIFEGDSAFRIEVARRFTTHNINRNRKRNAPILADERARIRTEVGREMFAAEFGRDPGDARALSGFIARASRQATRAVAGYDLTFSPVKSVSTLWAVAPREVAEQIEAGHQAAIADTIRYLERVAGFTREGCCGVRQVEVTGLIGATFTHRDSRAGDPDLHTHVAVSNKVQTRDGKWLALDGRVIFKAAVSASEHYNTRLEAELVDRLGVAFEERLDADPGKQPVREIVGVDARLTAFWSQRRAAIDTRRANLAARFQVDHGRPPSAIETLHLAQQATLETREAKHEPRSFADQRQAWHEQALGILGRASLRRMLTAVTRPGAGRSPVTDEWVTVAAEQTLAAVAEARATWQVWHVRAEAQRRARAAGIALADLHSAVDKVVHEALSPARSIPLGTADPVQEPQPLRRSDGTSVYTVAGSQLYTSSAVLDAEQRLVAAAQRYDGRRLTATEVDLALLEATANGITLNDLQAQMVRELATSGARVQLAIAPAGAGKTTAMRVLAGAWTAGGGQVIGLAPSAAAAAALRAELGSRADTLAKLTHSLTTGLVPPWIRGIDATTLVIIDEAGMAGTADVAQAVDYILTRGGAVRLVGDDQQLASAAAGGALRDIAEAAGVVTLSQLMRFTDPAEAAATLALRAGDPAGLGFYLDHSRVHVGDETTATDHAYRAWSADRAAGRDAIMLAPTRDLIATLNGRARADRLAHRGGDRGREIRLADGNLASAGDPIITRRNNRTLIVTATDWVKNGDRWTITQVQRRGALQVRHHRTGRTITLPADYVTANADLGYATTVHGAQGITADTCHTVATGEEHRQLFYVAMTRGRAANHVYLITAGDGEEHTVIRPESLFPPTATDILTRVLNRDEAQRSASSLARQLADPDVLLHDAVARYHDALGFAAEQVLGPERLAGIDAAAVALRDRLTYAPAYPTLRAHLALLAVHGHDPIAALTAAGTGRELDTAQDPAAVLDWRLDDGHRTTTGPLPWLAAVPAELRNHPQWGDYLTARAERVGTLAALVAQQAAGYTPTTAPAWAARLLDPAHDQLRADLAVWRAACGIPAHDRCPTGPPQLATAATRYQNDLTARAQQALGDPSHASRVWAALVDRLDPRLSADPYWPELAERLAGTDRAGIDVPGLVRAAAAERPLPDEQPAAALWWRISRHLSPAALTATARSGAATLRPSWTPTLTITLGTDRAERVMDDPAWPALVAAVNTAIRVGWAPGDVLQTAAELAHLDQTTGNADLTPTLVWRVAMLADPAPFDLDEAVPPDPQADQFAPPEDLDDLDLPVDPNTTSIPDRHTPPCDPDHDGGAPADDIDAALTCTAVEEAVNDPQVQLQAAMRSAQLLRGPLQPTEDQLWAAQDEEYTWATATVPKTRLLELNEQAAEFFTSCYPHSWAAQTLRARLGTDLIGDPRYTAGYAPASFTQLTNHLRRRGATDTELLAAGLGKPASTGRIIDVFRDRVVFSIYGPTGSGTEIHGFIGRRNPATADDDPYAGPKYLNSPQTDLFSKAAQLFGLHEGQAALDAGAVPVLVEGPLDAIAVTLATDGTHIGVATLGTAFTDRQADQLRAFIGAGRPGVVVATDADPAGQHAAERAYWQLTARGDNPGHVLLAAGYDPAQLLERDGPAALRAALNNTQPLAATLIDDRLRRHPRQHSTAEVVAATWGAAEVIGALPPEHWLHHINQVTSRLNVAPGAIQLAVIDAARAWSTDPRGQAHQQIARTACRSTAGPVPDGVSAATAGRQAPHDPAPVPGTDPPAKARAEPAVLDRLHQPHRAVTRSGSDIADGTRAELHRPQERWRALADSIDPRLTAAADWAGLATTLDHAAMHGLDIDQELPRLVTVEPLPEHRPVRELQYRVIAAISLSITDDPEDADKARPAPPPEAPTTSSGQHRPRGPTR
jgi:DNA primase catalytic core